MRFREVRLHAPADSLPALRDFYVGRLGVERVQMDVDALALAVGETRLVLAPGEADPFYHFALLVPGDRFAELLEWAVQRVELLPDAESGDVVFDFANWDALACYLHDPAGNIVELIAHRGVGESGGTGRFSGRELLGVSEVGLVGDPAAAAAGLAAIGVEVWAGTLDAPEGLAFAGEKARTLILARPGRGWIPTRRPAESHPVEIELDGTPEGEVHLAESRATVRRRVVHV